MATDAQVREWLANNPDADDATIATVAREAGVTADQLARVTKLDVNAVQKRVAKATLGRDPVTLEEQQQSGLLTDTQKTVQGVVNNDVASLADYIQDQRSKGEKVNPDYFTDNLGYSYDDLVIAQGVAMAQEERDQLAAEGKDTSAFDQVLDTQPPAVIYGQYIDYKNDDNIAHKSLRDETLQFEAKGPSGDRIGDPGQFNNSGINAVADPLKNYAKYLLQNPEELAKTVALAYLGQVSPTFANIKQAYDIVSDPMSAATSFLGSKVTGDLIGKAGSDLFDDPALQGVASGLVSAGVQNTLGGDPLKAFAQELKGTSIDILPDIGGEDGLLAGLGVTLPDISLPSISLPDVSLPDVNLQALNAELPDFNLSGLDLDTLQANLPNIRLPDVTLGDLDIGISSPDLSGITLGSLDIDIPDISLGDVPTPQTPDMDDLDLDVPDIADVNIPGLSLPQLQQALLLPQQQKTKEEETIVSLQSPFDINPLDDALFSREVLSRTFT